jgi:hypothetical protein
MRIYLTEAYEIDNKSILRILTQNKQINKSDPDYSYYEKLATWANEKGRQQKLKNIDLNVIQLSDKGLIEKRKLTTRYNTLGHVLNALKNLMDQEGGYAPSNELSRLIQLTTLEILAGLSKMPMPERPDEPETPESPETPGDEPDYGKLDWTAEKARRLKSSKGTPSAILDKFYSDYYNIEYAGGTYEAAGDPSIVTKLRSLDKILIPEFNALGYNPEVNPFAQFLKILIERKRDIFDRLTTNNYGAIHNSFIKKYITGNMLGNYSEDNILFCKDLYNYNGLDIVNYLSLWDDVYSKADGDATTKKLFAAKILINQPNVEGNTYTEKVNSLKALTNKDIMLPTADDAKLKSALEIRELYRHLFNVTPKKRVNIDEIVNEAKKQSVVLAMIRHILYQDDFRRAYPDDTKETRARLEDLGYKYNETKNDTCEDILSEYVLDAESKYNILAKLIIAHNQGVKDKKEADN